MSNLAHPLPAACKVQFPDTVPSIRWDALQAPAIAKPSSTYQGHDENGSGVQRHSMDDAYARFGLVMEARESVGLCGPRRLWFAKKGERVVAAHPRHDAARFMALALLTGG